MLNILQFMKKAAMVCEGGKSISLNSHAEGHKCQKPACAPEQKRGAPKQHRDKETRMPARRAIKRYTPTCKRDQSIQVAGQPGEIPLGKKELV